jgi:hypothetical protein
MAIAIGVLSAQLSPTLSVTFLAVTVPLGLAVPLGAALLLALEHPITPIATSPITRILDTFISSFLLNKFVYDNMRVKYLSRKLFMKAFQNAERAIDITVFADIADILWKKTVCGVW